MQNFARNRSGDQAFVSPSNPVGFNRPTNIRFEPDGCAYVVDYGAVRDPGGGPGGATRFVDPADAAGADPRHRRDLQGLP